MSLTVQFDILLIQELHQRLGHGQANGFHGQNLLLGFFWGKPLFVKSSHGLRFACPRCDSKAVVLNRAIRLKPYG
jgi:hypothetical protein